MSHPVFFVTPKSGGLFRRWTISADDGRHWNAFDECWVAEQDSATLYADQTQACIDCAVLQRRVSLPKKELIWATVPIQVEALSDHPLDHEALRNWLFNKLNVTIDISEGTGPTPDAVVFACVRWEKFEVSKEPLQ